MTIQQFSSRKFRDHGHRCCPYGIAKASQSQNKGYNLGWPMKTPILFNYSHKTVVEKTIWARLQPLLHHFYNLYQRPYGSPGVSTSKSGRDHLLALKFFSELSVFLYRYANGFVPVRNLDAVTIRNLKHFCKVGVHK